MLLAFDEFVYDDTRRELWRANTPLVIDAKPLKLLEYFLKHPGVLISKQELLDHVWESRAMADSVMSVSVAKLRKALGHKKGEREYIDNLYGRGYRFLRSVRRIESNAAQRFPTPTPSQGYATEPPLVGRASVLQRLDCALSLALAGKGRICFLVGEPGIGKTRMAEALEKRAAATGARWAWARCHAMESEPPLWLWTNILREYLNTAFAHEIQKVLDERINELMRFTEAGDLATEWESTAATAGHRAFDGIIQVLKRLSEQQPLVLVLDDLQWADTASLRLLSYLVVEVARWSILVIATLRTTEFDPRDGRNKHLSYVLGHSHCERIPLHRLTEADVADYVAALFGQADERLSREVFEKSEGNPFFMVELLRPWIDSRRPAPHELGFSNLALDIMRQRVRKLDSETRGMLSVAAVIGRNFDLNILSYLMERDEDDLLDLLDEPLANDTIVASSDGAGRFAFGHELIRDVLYDGLSATECKSWHLRVGKALERRRESGREVANAELAQHFLSALPRGEIAEAINYASSAAMEAMRFFAFADAYALLSRALQAIQSTDHPDLHLLCGLLLKLSSVERRLSDSRYSDHLSQAIKLAREHGFGRLLAMAGQRLVVGPSNTASPEARGVLEAAEKMLPEEDKEERAIVLANLAWTAPHCMNSRRINELLTRADTLARESNSLLALTTVLRAKLFFAGNPADQLAARAITEELERLPISDPELIYYSSVDIQVFRIVTCIQSGDQEALQRAINDFGATARKYKSTELMWHHQRMGVIQRTNAGDLVGISEALSELRERAEKLPIRTWQVVCELDLGILLSRTTDMRPFAAEFRDRLRIEESDIQSIFAYKIQKMTEYGLLSEAETALRRLPVALIDELPVDRNYLITLTRLAVGSIATGAMEYVETLYRLLTPYPRYYAAGISLHCDGSVSYFLGMLAHTLGRSREAIAHLEEALVQNERFGLKTQVVRTRYELARTLADNTTRTARKRARSLLKQALEDARNLGLQRLASDAEHLLAELTQ